MKADINHISADCIALILTVIFKSNTMLLIQKIGRDFSNHIMGYSAISIIISTCLGGIAIMGALTMGTGLMSMMMVFATVAICGAHNAAILTVQKPSLIYKLLWASIIINALIIALTF